MNYETYGFRFKGSHQQRIAGIHSLGWEKQTEASYDWDGLDRSEIEAIVFQYTLAGQGEIRIKDRVHQLGAGEAFFVKIPSNHRYRLPEDSDQWEFIHITLFGDEAVKTYQQVINEFGHILKVGFYDSPITHILDLLTRVSKNEINDSYETSSAAYSFLMKLQRFLLKIGHHKKVPEAIAKALFFIDNQYVNQISLDDIVAVSGLSKYHFSRLFNQTIHSTPIQYLTKVRINNSIELLKNKELTIEDIATRVGFTNGNYFNKVFRSSTGLSAGRYRNNKLLTSVDHLITD